MLRRSCARLVDDLVSAVAAARRDAARAAKAARAKGKKRRREELASGGPRTGTGTGTGTGAKEALGVSGTEVGVGTDVNVARRAAWLRDVLVPKCYLAFSQLTADNQFAPLGVVLLGVLAQTQAACDSAAPRPAAPCPSSPSARDNVSAAGVEPDPPNGGDAATIPASGNQLAAPSAPEPELRPSETQRAPERDEGVSNNSTRGGGGGGGREVIEGNEKGGKAIPREAVERAAELRKKGKGKGLEDTKAGRGVRPTAVIATNSEHPSEATEAAASTPSSKRRVLSAPDSAGDKAVRPAKKLKTAAPLPRGGGSDGDGEKGEKRKKQKKKKTAKKGDEFDDLFKDLF